MAAIEVNVSVEPAYLPRFASVARAARKAGLNVTQQLKDIGVLSGSIDTSKLDALAAVPGIAAVEVNREIRLAPPDSDAQ